jgi:HSP20 family molecular chaperone IbpA
MDSQSGARYNGLPSGERTAASSTSLAFAELPDPAQTQVPDPNGVQAMTQVLHAAHESEFKSMARQMSKWVDHVLGPNYQQYRRGEAWCPAVNLYEDQSNYYVIVELAGLCAEDIDIRLDETRMVISGRRAAPEIPGMEDEVCMHLMEIDHGPFLRTLDLSPDADTDAIEANLGRGYLTIRVPKKV